MRPSEYIMVIAVLVGPVIAIQISQVLDRRREARQRKLSIFKTLMVTRASGLAPEHVQALNTIDIEFYGTDRKAKDVIHAWKAYLDHLNNLDALPPEAWGPKRVDLFIELLYRMATALGYDFDRTSLKRTSYMPKWYTELEDDQLTMRKGLASILSGEDAFPMKLMYVEPAPQSEEAKQEAAEKQKKEVELQQILADSLSGKTPMKVTLVSEEGPSTGED